MRAREQHVGTSPIEFAPHRGRPRSSGPHRGPRSCSNASRSSLSAQDAGIDELANNRGEVPDAEIAQRRKIADREPSPRAEEAATATRSAIAGSRARRLRMSPLVRGSASDPTGESRAPGHHGDDAFLRQAADEFDQQELIAAGALDCPKQSFIGSRREQVRHDLLDRFVAQRIENDLRRSFRREFGQRCVHLR